MAAATSPATGQAYGVKRVCAILGVARSSFYDAQRQDARSAGRPAGRRGPQPALSDADLCLPPSAGIWTARRGAVRDTAKSGRGCG
jgi:hypothetical protein